MTGLRDTFVLAIDGGGTQCRGALSDGVTTFRARGGAANVSSDFDGALAVLGDVLDQLAAAAGGDPRDLTDVPAHLALAGVTGPDMASRVAAALPLHRAEVAEDTRAALVGALGPSDGMLAHCGTGSFFAAQQDGRTQFRGGWGPGLGDEASAHWVARRALALTLQALESGATQSVLAQNILNRFQGRAGVIAFAGQADQSAMAALAPMVTGAAPDDVLARQVLQDGADHITATLRAMGWQSGLPLCLTGGIGPHYLPFLPPEMQENVASEKGKPLDGALALARIFADRAPAQPLGTRITFTGGPIFDGQTLLHGHAARYENGQLLDVIPAATLPPQEPVEELNGDILSPGFTDLQVNGGGGVMLGAAGGVEVLTTIAQAHRAQGTTTLLPTLITDTPEVTTRVIRATSEAIRAGIPGIAGLHLEGPHLAPSRKGAHDAALIRPMQDADLELLLTAARDLPLLKVTLAPENVTPAQVEALAGAGVLVALGHTDADFDTSLAYARAGARCVTHLFNAMSGLGHRAPGVVGAALDCGTLSAGLIADGIHVHPAAMRAAWAGKVGPGGMYLVTDAMAVAGTDLRGFTLNGLEVLRRDGALRLPDGTLAGADLTMTGALRVLRDHCGLGLEQTLPAAISRPAGLLGRVATLDRLQDCIRVRADLSGAAPIAPV